MRWTDLSIHLIETHAFFQGKGSAFRLEPAELAAFLKLPAKETTTRGIGPPDRAQARFFIFQLTQGLIKGKMIYIIIAKVLSKCEGGAP